MDHQVAHASMRRTEHVNVYPLESLIIVQGFMQRWISRQSSLCRKDHDILPVAPFYPAIFTDSWANYVEHLEAILREYLSPVVLATAR